MQGISMVEELWIYSKVNIRIFALEWWSSHLHWVWSRTCANSF